MKQKYHLVICYIAMERSTIFHGKTHYKWPFSMVTPMIMQGTKGNKAFNDQLGFVGSFRQPLSEGPRGHRGHRLGDETVLVQNPEKKR